MRCEECGRVMENAELWQLGGDRNAPTSRSMRQMCWECRTKFEPTRPQTQKSTHEASAALSQTVIADVNEAASAFESGVA